MAITEKAKSTFTKRYGIAFDEVCDNPSDPLRVQTLEALSENMPITNEHYGRGYVSFGHSISAKEADANTLAMLKDW